MERTVRHSASTDLQEQPPLSQSMQTYGCDNNNDNKLTFGLQVPRKFWQGSQY